MVAGDFSRRITGFGFVLFSIVACLWVYSGITAPDGMPLAIQNGVLLFINVFGVWQFLISRKKKQEIDKAAEIAERAKQKLAQE